MFREEFIDGNFYKICDSNHVEHISYIKFDRFKDKNIIVSYYEIHHNSYFSGVGVSYYEDNINSAHYSPIDISVIVVYLPENHPDRLNYFRKKNIALLLNI